MALLNRGRLSVQQVDKEAWDAICKIAANGYEGLEGFSSSVNLKKRKGEAKDAKEEDGDDENDNEGGGTTLGSKKEKSRGTRKSKRTKT